ncbi:phosphate ABC transporter periplasmic phosphate-binding protein PstS [Photobacterium aphoticum]|uniref:Phosphate ABC transporter periplasmic phosphate-binding protein PstS n=1 Tax=Photobacterium aphoticum TaxID=754436 RepID=A0A090R0C3_9GAMM|nr:phosphate ABC transporter periplasmic phosphate-binding protein PstS [Photobacterium aphoticum]
MNEQPGSASVVQSVASSLNSIGYSGVGYQTTGIRAIPIAEEGTDYVEPTQENAASGRYPLSRYLYIYINKRPNKPLPPLEAEFIRFILSSNGQDLVAKDGYVPLPVHAVNTTLEKLGL